MRIFKLIIISFVLLFFIITIISLFIPSDVQISKVIQVNAAKDSVMIELSDPGNWKNWYPADAPVSPFYINGKEEGIVINNATGLVIREKKENEVIAAYTGPGSKDISTGWKVIPGSGSVAVEWYMKFHLGWYPWKKFSSLLFEKRYGPVLEQGLHNLKSYLETNHSSN